MILASGADFERNNILLYTGVAAEWQLDGISADQNAIYRVSKNRLTLLKSDRSTSMGRSDTLSGFISYAMEHFPASEYGLILWNHSCGATVWMSCITMTRWPPENAKPPDGCPGVLIIRYSSGYLV